ncbi:MAG: thioredoxin family protein [Pseudomonadota bacterium]
MASRLFFFCLLILSTAQLDAADFSNWQHNAVGYFKAERHANQKKMPMVVYFHTDWCEQCAKLNANYLSDRKVKRLLDNFVRVEINPEKGPKDYALFQEYQTQAFPGFFVVLPSLSDKRIRVHPLHNTGDWSVDQFHDEIRDFVTENFLQAGKLAAEKGSVRQAIKWFEKSLKFDNKNAEIYFELGQSYQALGESAYANRAKQYFAKAERLDPKFALRE